MGKRITTLNEDKGKQISSLEALLIVMDKLIEDKLEQKPNAGITIAKGKPNEKRIRYNQVRHLFRAFRAYFEKRGCMSIGICETCAYYKNSVCSKDKKPKDPWDTCYQHSLNGGGHGI